MTIVYKSGNIHTNADGLSGCALANTTENPAWVPQEKQYIEGICVTDIVTEFFKKVKESYKMDKNCHILCQLLIKDCKDTSLSSKLDEIWKNVYDEGRYHLLDGILYHRIKHKCSVSAGHLSEDKTLEKVKTCSWWPNWKKDVSEYCQTCDRCQKSKRATGKKFGMMIQIQEPKSTWEIAHMDWVTALPPGGDRSYNAFLVLVDRYSKTSMFLPCNKDDTAMDTAIMIWNKAISHIGLFQHIISDRDPKFTSALLTNLHNLFGTKLSFLTAYHPQTDGLAERMIQTLEVMIRRFCAYGLEFKYFDGFNHDWCTLIPALELAYKTSIHSSTGKTPEMLEKGWNPRLPYDTLKKDLVDIHPTADSFKLMLDKARHHANRLSTPNVNHIKGQKKLKDSFAGPFMMKALHGPNYVKLELTGELMNKHPDFPISLIKPYSSSDKEFLPLRNKPPLEIPPLEERGEKKIVKVLEERRTRNKKEREYLVRYRNPTQEDEWLAEKDKR
ncbi:hypothetical protein O181_080852 [Austropuccinia psidii MF-1]|uniref:Integrase catalytic domain-containing protein n=1 Tax=Austropuccinia psidii MF-1 TaxID=1389203 RepID=A0A9Q3IHU3_9BASI|nr:hypothetical protein [Austropuccinia psidii MF-1]